MADSKTQNQSYDKHQNMATIVTIVFDYLKPWQQQELPVFLFLFI
jgi:hypothetical protein